MPNTTIWIMTVALFADEQSQAQSTQQFADLSACIAASEQFIREWEQTQPNAHQHLTASCLPNSQ